MATPTTVPAPPSKKTGGWKSKLGGILKALGGVVLGYFLENVLPGLIANVPTTGMGMTIGGLFIADAIQKYGLAHKQERTIEAVEENTAAVKADTNLSARIR